MAKERNQDVFSESLSLLDNTCNKISRMLEKYMESEGDESIVVDFLNSIGYYTEMQIADKLSKESNDVFDQIVMRADRNMENLSRGGFNE